MSVAIFRDRVEAGMQLAGKLAAYAANPEVIVLALPRGGLPVAREIAIALRVPLDIFLVRKLGVPGNEEFAFGAVAEGGVQYIDRRVVASLNISEVLIQRAIADQEDEIARRQRLYRGNRPPPKVEGKIVILVDDGIATGSTARAAIQALRLHRPMQLILATPVAPVDTCSVLNGLVDKLVCLEQSDTFFAVGQWYDDFQQVPDDEVREILAHAWQSNAHLGDKALSGKARIRS